MRLRPVLLGMLFFLSGAAAALLVEHTVILHRRAGRGDASLSHTTISHRAFIAQLDSTLHLTPAQQESLALILHRHQPDVDSAWRSINQRLGAAMDSVHLEMEAVLDSGQTATFRRWLRHQHQPQAPDGTAGH
ncbi:MAG: hypothetical protein FIB01_05535 [Gemmatimonadetes bacterium]|nr:hypothetical protein [Gemmatimonadota bacterium]